MQRARIWPALAGAALLAAIGALVALRTPEWPDPDRTLTALGPHFASDFGRRRIALDPGHGARDNTGNRSAYCVDEQDFTLSLATDVAAELERTGHFEVVLTRRAGESVEYADRVTRAQAWGAELFVSLHSDVRGHVTPWSPQPGLECPNNRDAPGFSVIFSDDADAELVARRRALAAALALRVAATGLLPYSGRAYAADYARVPDVPGTFVDRHAPGHRIFLLHRPSIPSVLIETHNAVDDREARRWQEPETRRAFASALAAALADVLGPDPRTLARAGGR